LERRPSTGLEVAERHARQGLAFDDVRHYQRMIVALAKMRKVMKEVDNIV
jgi:hypothetical protein